MMEYKGYLADPKYYPEDGCFSGVVLNISDTIHFEGKTVEDLDQAFRDSVEDYLEMCREDGVEPKKPFSGKFLVRISPELHRRATLSARHAGMSLNAFVAKALEKAGV